MPADVGDRPSYSVPPPVPPIVALILIVVLDLVAPVEFLPQAVSLVVGIPLLVAGLGFWGWGIASLAKQGESPDPFKPTNRLLTGGALRYSRNPIYAGGTVGLLGLALLLDTATGVAVAVVLGLLANRLALEEERFLEAKFGDEYRQYRSRVGRWI
ncbi:MAG: methyltransferase family protein [Solirubrobacterales bacterium]